MTVSPGKFPVPFLLFLAACGSAPLLPETEGREIRLTMEATLAPLPEGSGPARIWLPAPISLPGQRILGPLLMEGKGGDPTELYDAFGNRILSIEGGPGRPLSLAYEVRLRRSDLLPPDPPEDSGSPWKDEDWARARESGTSREVRREALFVIAGETGWFEKARKLADWIGKEFRLGPRKGGLEPAWRARMGDLFEIHEIYVEASRLVGIPARLASGLALPETPEGGPPPIAWAEVHLPGLGWIPVDLLPTLRGEGEKKEGFGALDRNRILLSRGRNLILRPERKAGPLPWFVLPYAEAGGRKVEGALKVRVRIEDLDS